MEIVNYDRNDYRISLLSSRTLKMAKRHVIHVIQNHDITTQFAHRRTLASRQWRRMHFKLFHLISRFEQVDYGEREKLGAFQEMIFVQSVLEIGFGKRIFPLKSGKVVNLRNFNSLGSRLFR